MAAVLTTSNIGAFFQIVVHVTGAQANSNSTNVMHDVWINEGTRNVPGESSVVCTRDQPFIYFVKPHRP